MNRFLVFILSINCCLTELCGQEYSLNSIPKDLLVDAHAVVLLDEAQHHIINEKKVIRKQHLVVAILNKRASYLARQHVYYDDNSLIKTFFGRVYDRHGKLIKKSKKSDLYDRSAISDFSIYEDGRIQQLDLSQTHYPYIVEFIYETEEDNTFSIGDKYVNPDDHIAVMKYIFQISSPENLFPNVKFVNTDKQFLKTEEDGIVNAYVEFDHLKARKSEPFGPSLARLTPTILLSPSKLKFEQYEGNFNSWKSMGLWQQQLNEGRSDLPASTKLKIKELTNQYTSQKEKIKAIYEFMQNKTRYVSIQLGIGGWQPFSASSVDELGYGDCKALSNYTQALLSTVGIESYYTLVYAGDNKVTYDPNFASRKFNHAILCVPNNGDTVWLECTSQTNPFGYQGSFTGDRDVMIVTPEGGKLVHTSTYGKEENQQRRNGEFIIHSNGNASAKIETRYTGIQYENNNINLIVDDGYEKQKKWILDHTDLPDFSIESFDFSIKKTRIPLIHERLNLLIRSAGSIQGKRMFLVPNQMNQWENVPPKTIKRQTDIILKTAFRDIDSLSYLIPEIYKPEYIPQEINIESVFGLYNANFSFDNHKLEYHRLFEMNKGTYDKSTYNEFRDFLNAVARADEAKAVFVKIE